MFGSLGRVGSTYIVTVTRVSARDAQVRARALEELSGNDEAVIFQAIPSLAAKLFDAPAPQTSEAEKTRGPRVMPWVLRAAAALVAGVGGIAVVAAIAAVGAFSVVRIADAVNVSSQKGHVVSWLGAALANAVLAGGLALAVIALPVLAGAAALLGGSFVVP